MDLSDEELKETKKLNKKLMNDCKSKRINKKKKEVKKEEK